MQSSPGSEENEQKIIVRAPKKLLAMAIFNAMSLHLMLCKKDVGHFYGMPTTDYQNDNKFRPEVQLIFYPIKSKENQAQLGYNPKSRSIITFRLVHLTSASITRQNIDTLAMRVRETFAIDGGLLWHKGKDEYTYTDVELGYNFRILATNEEQAKILITKTMALQEHHPDWKKLFKKENSEPEIAYPAVPPTKIILGEQVQEAHERPGIVVRYSHFNIHIHDKRKPIIIW